MHWRSAVPHSARVELGRSKTTTNWRVNMGLISFSLPYAQGAEPQFTDGPHLNLEGNPSQWLADDQRLPLQELEETVSDRASKTLAFPSSAVNQDLRLGAEIRSEPGFEGIVG